MNSNHCLRLAGAVSLAAVLLVGMDSAEAHHSFAAEFDPELSGEVEGVVTRVWFTNPHVRYRLEVVGSGGGTEEWELQLTSVTNLRNSQWYADTVEVGDRIVASGELARDGSHKLYARRITTEDGSSLGAPGGRRPAADGGDLTYEDYGYGQLNAEHPFDISGAWNNGYKFRVTVDDLEPKPTPFTDAARAIYEDTVHYDDYSLRCMAPGLPRIIGAPYTMEIVDAGSHYLVVHTEHNMPRRIFMDGRTPPENTQPSSLGYSIGRWESDNVLVIETSHLLPGWLDGSGMPMSGEGTRIVERWEFAEDRLTMDRIMTVYDPYYTEPLVRRRGSSRGPNVEVFEMASCDPQSYYRDLYESGQIEEYLYR
jgi:hypothetical protein